MRGTWYNNKEMVTTDVLVVGGGGAAARAALAARTAGATVRLVTKGKNMADGSTVTAVSELFAIGAALRHANDQDSPEIHYQDTLRAGEGFINPELVRILAEEAPERVLELKEWGVPFQHEGNYLAQRLSDFASYPRVCWVEDGATGREIVRVLLGKLKELEVPIDEEVMIVQMLENEGSICGAVGLEAVTNRLIVYRAKSVVLATGGAQQLYKFNVGSKMMTGDGYALALDLGLPVINMEFVQFGPGMIYPKTQVLSGPIYRLQPRLYNGDNEEFLHKYLPMTVTETEVFANKAFPFSANNISKYLDLAIFQEVKSGRSTKHGGVLLDLRSSSADLMETIPITWKRLQELGIDPREQCLEVSIIAQCMNGGVLMKDPNGETDIDGLFVAGEVAGGARGPDRPGGNSLAECQVFGHRAGWAAAQREGSGRFIELSVRWAEAGLKNRLNNDSGPAAGKLRHEVQQLMWDNCLVIRDEAGLKRTMARLEELTEMASSGFSRGTDTPFVALGTANLITVARTVALSALLRRESRSTHYRKDYPQPGGSEWVKSLLIRQAADGSLTATNKQWVEQIE